MRGRGPAPLRVERGSEAPGPAALEWRDVSLTLEGFAVRRASLRVEAGEWVTVLGPTGAGKSLLLEMAAGFRAPSAGRVLRNGVDVTAAPPETRGIALVPQDDLLFPHRSVRGNLLFAAAAAADGPDVLRVAAALGISHLLDRRVQEISGGEAQRVAIGRALLSGFPVLLLDECTSALDEDTREEVGRLLAGIAGERGHAVVQVTHDRAEAERLAHRIVTMADGRLQEEPAGSAVLRIPTDRRWVS